MENLPLRAIIIDDERKGIVSLRLLLETYVPEVKVVAESKRASAALELIENYQPEIVFLDINMPGMNGFELLDNLRWKNFYLVFVTAHQQYALKAIKNNAADYILKPVDYRELRLSIDRIRQRMNGERERISMDTYASLLKDLSSDIKGKNGRILVSLKSGIEHIDPAEIVFLEAITNYTRIHLKGMRTVLSSRNLKEYEEYLCNAQFSFMRVHKSFVVNLKLVARFMKIQNTIVMTDESLIPLGKSRKDDFFDWLNVQ